MCDEVVCGNGVFDSAVAPREKFLADPAQCRKFHACHAKQHGVSETQALHQSQPSAVSAMRRKSDAWCQPSASHKSNAWLRLRVHPSHTGHGGLNRQPKLICSVLFGSCALHTRPCKCGGAFTQHSEEETTSETLNCETNGMGWPSNKKHN